MNKELAPLKALNEIMSILNYYKNMASRNYQTIRLFDELNNYEKTIETALKDYEELKKLKLLPYPKVNDEEYRRSVIKRLQALEIINEKNVCIHDLKKSKTLEEYNGCRAWEEELTQEEYDLLKEVLL